MSDKRKYDSTVARIAGNIASGLAGSLLRATPHSEETVARECVSLARAIVAEVERTEPQPMTMTAALCTCHVVSGGFRATNANCPTHGNIERSYPSSHDGATL